MSLGAGLDWALWGRAAGALLAVLLLAWLAAFALRRSALAGRPKGRPGARLELLESLALDPRRRLLLVRCDGREWLLLCGGAQDLVVGPPAP